MRSAREWEMQIGFESALQKDIIQQIQLDAMKEGMRRAAKFATIGSAKIQIQNEENILTASEQLTIKDLEV